MEVLQIFLCEVYPLDLEQELWINKMSFRVLTFPTGVCGSPYAFSKYIFRAARTPAIDVITAPSLGLKSRTSLIAGIDLGKVADIFGLNGSMTETSSKATDMYSELVSEYNWGLPTIIFLCQIFPEADIYRLEFFGLQKLDTSRVRHVEPSLSDCCTISSDYNRKKKVNLPQEHRFP